MCINNLTDHETRKEKIMRILNDTAYIRTSGTDKELECAEYIASCCREMHLEASIESFPVKLSEIYEAKLVIDNEEIPCTGYFLSGSSEIRAPFYYLANTDPCSLSKCRGKIVMVDGYMGYWMYRDIINNGAAGFITYDGNLNYSDCDIDQRELRSFVSCGDIIPGVHINAKKAVQLIESNAEEACILINQNEYDGKSHNVVLELPGESSEVIALTAHYDSTWLSQGVYDNMSGSVGLLEIAEYFSLHPHNYTLRFIWCGSEERGLLGSKAYVSAHENELSSIVLNINLDMIGCTMGRFIACCSAEQQLVHYISYLASETGFGIAPRQGVYSSDSTPFADKGIPAVSFARLAPSNTASIHNRYDTIDVMNAGRMTEDIDFIISFTRHMACAVKCPVGREIPDKVKEELDYYMFRKRRPQES